ncbi:hypothetical protein Cgig2_033220 [Carnegiea gigantea]|uniref:Chromo domain-containing protein n=1 Tax=Carnegiea gigantea TaxID=171969 RepID=A0A9Q1QBL6_9CARY|nr:hypothetical protein Cgig2_033220 [Carnegiea gigantea]
MAIQSQQGISTMEELLKNLLEQQTTMAKQMAEQQQQISVQNQKMEEQRQLCNQMLTLMRHIGIKQDKNPMNPLNSDQNMIGDVDGGVSMETRHNAHLEELLTAVLERRMVKKHNRAVVQYLMLWDGQPESEAAWEEADTMEEKYPAFFADLQT